MLKQLFAAFYAATKQQDIRGDLTFRSGEKSIFVSPIFHSHYRVIMRFSKAVGEMIPA